MACCIFVAMIITNILVVYRRFKAMLGLRTDAANDFWQPEPAPRTPRYRHWVLPLLLLCTTGFGTYYWDDIRSVPVAQVQTPH